MIPILVLKTENKVIYNKSNLNCKTFFEEFTCEHSTLSSNYKNKKAERLWICEISFQEGNQEHSTLSSNLKNKKAERLWICEMFFQEGNQENPKCDNFLVLVIYYAKMFDCHWK